MKYYNIIGAILIITAITLAWIWFSYKLPIIIYLALLGNNLERKNRH